MGATANLIRIEITSAAALRDWLLKNHRQKESIWLVTYKKVVPEKYVSTAEVLDELLCFGWIDGIRRKLDAERSMQLISPRKAQHWAGTYKERARKLIENGRMHPSGLEAIEASKKSGLWNFMDDVDALIVPRDLAEALSAMEGAPEFFDSINASSKRFVLRWIKLAKTAKTRASRIKRIGELAAKKKKLPGS